MAKRIIKKYAGVGKDKPMWSIYFQKQYQGMTRGSTAEAAIANWLLETSKGSAYITQFQEGKLKSWTAEEEKFEKGGSVSGKKKRVVKKKAAAPKEYEWDVALQGADGGEINEVVKASTEDEAYNKAEKMHKGSKAMGISRISDEDGEWVYEKGGSIKGGGKKRVVKKKAADEMRYQVVIEFNPENKKWVIEKVKKLLGANVKGSMFDDSKKDELTINGLMKKQQESIFAALDGSDKITVLQSLSAPKAGSRTEMQLKESEVKLEDPFEGGRDAELALKEKIEEYKDAMNDPALLGTAKLKGLGVLLTQAEQDLWAMKTGTYHLKGGVKKKRTIKKLPVVVVTVTDGVAEVTSCPKGVECYVVDGDAIKNGEPYEFEGKFYNQAKDVFDKMLVSAIRSEEPYAIIKVIGGVATTFDSHGVKVVIKDSDVDDDDIASNDDATHMVTIEFTPEHKAWVTLKLERLLGVGVRNNDMFDVGNKEITISGLTGKEEASIWPAFEEHSDRVNIQSTEEEKFEKGGSVDKYWESYSIQAKFKDRETALDFIEEIESSDISYASIRDEGTEAYIDNVDTGGEESLEVDYKKTIAEIKRLKGTYTEQIEKKPLKFAKGGSVSEGTYAYGEIDYKPKSDYKAGDKVVIRNEDFGGDIVTKITDTREEGEGSMKEVIYVTADGGDYLFTQILGIAKGKKFAKGGSVGADRMYNFLKDDWGKFEKAVNEGDKEEVDRFFSYWIGSNGNGHLKSLKTEANDRMYNFLKDDLEKLEKAVNEDDQEEINRFFSYWSYHLESLKMAKGGSVGEKYISFTADSDESATLFDDMDFDYKALRRGNVFYFQIPESMTGDELIDILEGGLKHYTDIEGDWDADTTFMYEKGGEVGSWKKDLDDVIVNLGDNISFNEMPEDAEKEIKRIIERLEIVKRLDKYQGLQQVEVLANELGNLGQREDLSDDVTAMIHGDLDVLNRHIDKQKFEKGGAIKGKKWIQGALSGGHKGALRKVATRKGILHGKHDTLTTTDLHKLEKMGGKVAKEAHLAETLSKFEKGGALGENIVTVKVVDETSGSMVTYERTHASQGYNKEMDEFIEENGIKVISCISGKRVDAGGGRIAGAEYKLSDNGKYENAQEFIDDIEFSVGMIFDPKVIETKAEGGTHASSKKRKIVKKKAGHKKMEKGGDIIGKGERGIGINWQSEFSSEDEDTIEEDIQNHVADMVENGFTSGELTDGGTEPSYSGWWKVDIQEDDNDEDDRNSEVARLIRDGNTSGYYPHWTFGANVWKDEEEKPAVKAKAPAKKRKVVKKKAGHKKMASGGSVNEMYGYHIGEHVACNGQEDKVVGFITPEDKENYAMGYRLVLEEEGTQSLGSVSKKKKA